MDLLTCKSIADRGLIELYLAGRIGKADAIALESHLLTCTDCQRELRIAATVRGLLRGERPSGLFQS